MKYSIIVLVTFMATLAPAAVAQGTVPFSAARDNPPSPSSVSAAPTQGLQNGIRVISCEKATPSIWILRCHPNSTRPWQCNQTAM